MVKVGTMEKPGKQAAQLRVDRIEAFREELAQLRSEGVVDLTPEQEQRIDRHLRATVAALATRFDVDTTESQRQISWGMRIASTAAGVALCLAVSLFFYRIWGSLSVPVQIALLVATPLLSIAGMEYASRRERTYYYTALLGIVAFAAAILNLSALGGMFNLTGSPYAFLVWAVFGIGLAYAYRLRLLLVAGLVCAIAFVMMILTQWSGLYWGAIDSRIENMIFAGLLMMAAAAILQRTGPEEFPWVYLILGLLTVLLGTFVLSLNGELTYLPFRRRTVEILYELAGFVISAVAIWRGVVRHAASIVNIGAIFFFVFLLIRMVEWWWDWMPKYLFFLVIGLVSLALLYGFQQLRNRASERSTEAA